MDKRVNQLLFSVIVIFTLVFVSIPLWDYASTKRGAILAESSSDLQIAVEMGKLPSLIIIEDERAFAHVEQTEISLRNRNDNQKDCELLLLIDKTSTLDYKLLRVSIDDKVIKLSDLETIEDQDNYYFILDKYTIKAYSDVKHNIRLWIGEEATNITEETKLIANFITR